jgi:3-oxoacyl-[acyl-carrier protein] reductase
VRRLDGRVALVTGGERGIGQAIVAAFLREGASVASVDVRRGSSSNDQNRFAYFATDVRDDELVATTVRQVVEHFGRLDILVNNAGITQRKAFTEITPAEWDAVFAVNIRGVFLVTRHVVPLMQRAGSGRIINVSSQLAQRGAHALAHYCAAKAGVLGLTKALARELAPAITVNAIAPGPVLTDMVKDRPETWFEEIRSELPLNRLGTPEEIAPTAVFLASDDGSLYTGQTLGPNSGHVMI